MRLRKPAIQKVGSTIESMDDEQTLTLEAAAREVGEAYNRLNEAWQILEKTAGLDDWSTATRVLRESIYNHADSMLKEVERRRHR